jgi:site-specific recombinase XerD
VGAPAGHGPSGRADDPPVTEAQITAVANIRRDDIEDYKVWLAGRHRSAGQVISRETHRQRLRTVRQFFERIIEWDWPDAPSRNPVIAGDIPKKPEPLPKFPGRPRRG